MYRNLSLKVKKDEAEVNMCKAIQDMIDEATIETTINTCKILNLDENKLIEILKENLKVDRDQAIKYLTEYRDKQGNIN